MFFSFPQSKSEPIPFLLSYNDDSLFLNNYIKIWQGVDWSDRVKTFRAPHFYNTNLLHAAYIWQDPLILLWVYTVLINEKDTKF